MKKLFVFPALILVAMVAQGGQPSLRAPRDFGIRALQLVPDSILVEIGPWGHSTLFSAVRGYVVRALAPAVEGFSFAWTRTDTLPKTQNIDSIWMPRDTIDMPIQICIYALSESQPSPDTCRPFTVPASTNVTAPGDFNVRIITNIGMSPDSISLAGLERTGNIIPLVNDSLFFLPIGWFGQISMLCGNLDTGDRGWIQVNPEESAVPYGWGMTIGGTFIPDPGCGWQGYSTNESVATLNFLDRIL